MLKLFIIIFLLSIATNSFALTSEEVTKGAYLIQEIKSLKKDLKQLDEYSDDYVIIGIVPENKYTTCQKNKDLYSCYDLKSIQYILKKSEMHDFIQERIDSSMNELKKLGIENFP